MCGLARSRARARRDAAEALLEARQVVDHGLGAEGHRDHIEVADGIRDGGLLGVEELRVAGAEELIRLARGDDDSCACVRPAFRFPCASS